MRIAYIGLKGLPGTFSGVETHVHELGTRLVRRGHEVTAYVRPQYTPRHIRDDDGIRLLHLPTIPSKHLDATVHSFLAALHATRGQYDIVHFHTIGPGCFALFSRLFKTRVVTTIHRFDYLSGKWGWFAGRCLRLAEQMCLRVSHRVIVVAPFLKAHYQAQGRAVTYIPNGATLPPHVSGSAHIEQLGLSPQQYLLFLGRLVPEKRPDWAIRAFMASGNEQLRLVIAGGSSATDEYVRHLQALAQPAGNRILFTGPVYGPLKDELLAHARTFVLPSALEGLPITLFEAMSYERPCLVSDIPPHRDVIQEGQNGFLHSHADFEHLCARLRDVMRVAPSDLARMGKLARQTVAEEYDWEQVVTQVERLYEQMLDTPQPVLFTGASARQ